MLTSIGQFVELETVFNNLSTSEGFRQYLYLYLLNEYTNYAEGHPEVIAMFMFARSLYTVIHQGSLSNYYRVR